MMKRFNQSSVPPQSTEQQHVEVQEERLEHLSSQPLREGGRMLCAAGGCLLLLEAGPAQRLQGGPHFLDGAGARGKRAEQQVMEQGRLLMRRKGAEERRISHCTNLQPYPCALLCLAGALELANDACMPA